MKPIELNPSSIKAIIDRASKIVLPIDEDLGITKILYRTKEDKNIILEKLGCPLQPNTEYYCIEEFIECDNSNSGENYRKSVTIFYKQKETESFDNWQQPDQMQPHQSRCRFKVTNVEVKKLSDLIKLNSIYKCGKDEMLTSDYVFLIDIKEIK